MAEKKRVILTILDGFGHRVETRGNAVAAARKPTFDMLHREYPHTLIEASGPWVGLPEGQMGNSEVGHLNIGSGRIIQMDVTRIDAAIAQGTLAGNPALQPAFAARRLHLLGLVSDGGVHSMNTHLYALLEMAKQKGVPEVYVHAFTDGRDTPPNSGLGFIEELEAKIREIGAGRIASVTGRYYAMDRDKRWERTNRALGALVRGDEGRAGSAAEVLKASYEHKVTDEFVEPVTLANEGLIRDGDAVVFFNFRADRARQITEKLVEKLKLTYVMMTQYDAKFGLPYAFGPETHENILGEVVSAHGLTNLRVAETEKYPHVTYFFNGGREKPFTGEEREMIASPKVATYDLQPEMSAPQVCDVVVNAIDHRDFDLIVVNFANPDMVGHTGVFEAAVKAVETCDHCLSRIWEAIRRHPYTWLVTADHGNSETMIDPETGLVHTYHTTNPVPFICIDESKSPLRAGGSLRDIAPTILGILGREAPQEMTGRDLRAR